jgi:hypothetical protein
MTIRLELLLSVGEVIREQDDAGSAFETLEELKWDILLPQGSDSSNDLK